MECILFASPRVCCSATESAQMPRIAHLQWIQISPLLIYIPECPLIVRAWGLFIQELPHLNHWIVLLQHTGKQCHSCWSSICLIPIHYLVCLVTDYSFVCFSKHYCGQRVKDAVSVLPMTSGGNQKGTLPWLLLDGTNRAMNKTSKSTNV